jgi:hypothetical protein
MSYQFLPTGGSKGSCYVLQLLCCKIHKIATTQQTDKQIITDLESLGFYDLFDACLNKLKNTIN